MYSANGKSKVSSEEMLTKAIAIIQTAKDLGATLRLVGGLAILQKTKPFPKTYEFLLKHRGMGNLKYADIDLVGYSKETKKINDTFEKLQFVKDKIVNKLFGDIRRIYYEPNNLYHVDIFLDQLDFNHRIELRGRLDLDHPTLNYADLLLSKFQIHFVNEKDLIDAIALLSISPYQNIDWKGRIFEILADDWEFYYDVINNLDSAIKLCASMKNDPNDKEMLEITEPIMLHLKHELEGIPKTRRWQKRMKIGTAKQWWRDVENVLR